MAFNWLSVMIAAEKLLFSATIYMFCYINHCPPACCLPLKQENCLVKEEEGIGGRSVRNRI